MWPRTSTLHCIVSKLIIVLCDLRKFLSKERKEAVIVQIKIILSNCYIIHVDLVDSPGMRTVRNVPDFGKICLSGLNIFPILQEFLQKNCITFHCLNWNPGLVLIVQCMERGWSLGVTVWIYLQ